MATQKITDYTFTPSTGRVTLNSLPTVDLKRLVSIKNVTRGTAYFFAQDARNTSVDGNTVILPRGYVGLADKSTDELSILYGDPVVVPGAGLTEAEVESLVASKGAELFSPSPSDAPSFLGQVVGFDPSAPSHQVRFFTKEEHVARALGWAIATDPRWAGGAVGDANKDNTAAINAAIDGMPSLIPAWGGMSGKLWFPAGVFNTNGGHVVPANKRLEVTGSGPYVTVLNQRTAATQDLLTINAPNSGVTNLTLNGRRASTGLDCLVLNAGYDYADNITIASGGMHGITVGKAGPAIAYRLTRINIRTCMGYGVLVVAGSGSTDGQWSGVDVGQNGLSGVRVSNGGQNLFDVHSWGNGLESSTDKHGIWLDSVGNTATGCQPETNLGNGFHLGSTGSEGNSVVGGKSWGNCGNGIYGYQSNKNTISGVQVFNNGVNNAGSNTASFAGIYNEGGVEWEIDANVYDNGKALVPGSYSGFTPTFPYPGRAASTTQSYGYAEATGADFNRISGLFRKERTKSGQAVLNIGSRNNYDGAILGDITLPVVASAATVTLPPMTDLISISGTVQITAINPSAVGRRVTLQFTDAAPGGIADAGNLRLAGVFTPAQYGTITLAYAGGSVWVEVSRSVN